MESAALSLITKTEPAMMTISVL
jgi:hypothetical protein